MTKLRDEKRHKGPYYDEQKVQDGLAWLAWQMKQHNLSELYLHQIHIDWFTTEPARWLPRFVKIGPVLFMLWDTKVISWGYVSFLNNTAHMHLLRNIGGSYTFVHRQLLEYFARPYASKSPSQPLQPLPTITKEEQEATVRVLPQQSRLCPKCRFALPIQARFCGRCGAKI
jgi:ribosomal protein L40E